MKHNIYERILAAAAAIIMIAMIAAAFLCTCKQIEYVPVVEHHTEIVHHNDTVHSTDTVKTEKETIIREARPEDSLLLAKMGIKLQQNERLLIMLQRELQEAKSQLVESHRSDSVVHDSVPYPVPVEKIVKERYTPKAVKVLAWIGGTVLVGLVGWLAIFLLKKFRKTGLV